STYLGGSGDDVGRGIAVDGQGQAYVTGETTSNDFPQAGTPPAGGGTHAFVTKLSAAGTPLSTPYFRGGGYDRGNARAVDRSCTTGCSAYVTGVTYSADFPQVNPLPAPNDALRADYTAFVTRLSAAGDTLVYSTYLGGSGAIYAPECGYICNFGYDGTEWPFGDEGSDIAVDAQGQAYVTGSTYSWDFPLANPLSYDVQGASDAFVAKLNAAGNALLYSTYLGGGTPRNALYISSFESEDAGMGIAVD